MNIKELLEKRAALLAELQKPETTAERFAEIRSEVDKINFTIEQIRKDDSDKRAEEERKAAEEADARAARLPNKGGVIFDQGKVQTDEKRAAEKEETEKQRKALKNGEKIAIEMRAAVASGSTALGVATSGTLNPAFEQVGTLDTLVNVVHLEGAGAESYKKPFVKAYGEGVITEEGKAPTTSAEPTFDYADINKVKIVAYAEVNEEVEKLPSANYMAEVDAASSARGVKNSFRRSSTATDGRTRRHCERTHKGDRGGTTQDDRHDRRKHARQHRFRLRRRRRGRGRHNPYP